MGLNGKMDVRATFVGLKGIPWFALAHNSLYPALNFGEREISMTVIRTVQRPYSELESVSVRQALWTHSLILEFADTNTTFVANFRSELGLSEALQVLSTKIRRGLFTPEAIKVAHLDED